MSHGFNSVWENPTKGIRLRLDVMTVPSRMITCSHEVIKSGEAPVHGLFSHLEYHVPGHAVTGGSAGRDDLRVIPDFFCLLVKVIQVCGDAGAPPTLPGLNEETSVRVIELFVRGRGYIRRFENA
jgi:hypothetical protein